MDRRRALVVAALCFVTTGWHRLGAHQQVLPGRSGPGLRAQGFPEHWFPRGVC